MPSGFYNTSRHEHQQFFFSWEDGWTQKTEVSWLNTAPRHIKHHKCYFLLWTLSQSLSSLPNLCHAGILDLSWWGQCIINAPPESSMQWALKGRHSSQLLGKHSSGDIWSFALRSSEQRLQGIGLRATFSCRHTGRRCPVQKWDPSRCPLPLPLPTQGWPHHPSLSSAGSNKSSSKKAKGNLWPCLILTGGAIMPQSWVLSTPGYHYIPICILHADPKLQFLVSLLLLTENSPKWQLYKRDVAEDKTWLTASLQMRYCQAECILICGFAKKTI